MTGRFYEELGEVIEKIKLREYNGFVASSNGLEIHDFLDGEKKCFTRLSKDEVKDIVKEAKKHHLVSYVWQNGGYTMFGVSILDVVKKIFSLIPLDSHYIKSLQKTKFETDVVLNEALYDKVCFVGFQIKKMYLEYQFYDVRKLGTELCKKDVGKLEAIRYIYV